MTDHATSRDRLLFLTKPQRIAYNFKCWCRSMYWTLPSGSSWAAAIGIWIALAVAVTLMYRADAVIGWLADWHASRSRSDAEQIRANVDYLRSKPSTVCWFDRKVQRKVCGWVEARGALDF